MFCPLCLGGMVILRKYFDKRDNMFFWNVNTLSSQLRKNQISEKEILKYFIGLIILDAVSAIHPPSLSVVYAKYQFIHISIFLLIDVLGAWFCFDANRRGDNKEFLNRMICLSFTSSIKFIAITFICSSIITVCIYFINWRILLNNNYFLLELLFSFFLKFLYYLYIRNKILSISLWQRQNTPEGQLSKQ